MKIQTFEDFWNLTTVTTVYPFAPARSDPQFILLFPTSKGFLILQIVFHHLGVLKELVEVEIFSCNAALTCCF